MPLITSDRSWLDDLAIPAIAAPMTGVSGPDLVIAACRSGVVGSFPTHNAATVEILDDWMRHITSETGGRGRGCAPMAPNLVVHRSNRRLDADLDCVLSHGVELVITSVGSPADVVPKIHAAGCAVLADVASLRHVERALDAGVDGLVLLGAGAGGQTGSANPLAFVRAVREHYDGLLVLAGGISDGASILAAQVLGADLAYLGTRFIATDESLAGDDYRSALAAATMDDVRLTSEVGGLPANVLAEWLESRTRETPAAPTRFDHTRVTQLPNVWGAGHGVTSVLGVTSVRELVAAVTAQYQQARHRLRG